MGFSVCVYLCVFLRVRGPLCVRAVVSVMAAMQERIELENFRRGSTREEVKELQEEPEEEPQEISEEVLNQFNLGLEQRDRSRSRSRSRSDTSPL